MKEVDYFTKLECLPNALTIYVNQKLDTIQGDMDNNTLSQLESSRALGSCVAYYKIMDFLVNYLSDDKSFNNIINNEHTNEST
jgi:hypothetical protein